MNDLRGNTPVAILDEMSFGGQSDGRGLHEAQIHPVTVNEMRDLTRVMVAHMRTLLASLELQLNNPDLPVDRRNDAYAQYKSLRDEMRKAGIDVPDFKPATIRTNERKPFTIRRAESFTERMRRKVGVAK